MFDRKEDGVLQEFADGETFANHHLFNRTDVLVLMIQVFYDVLGTTNPLRGQNTLHYTGVFFFTQIKNLPSRFNNCFSNVHLLALCYSKDLNVYGFELILRKFVTEMNLLQRSSISVDVELLGKQTIYASLCHVTCDNLALNRTLGYIESFSADFFCTLWYATQDSIQKYFRSDMFRRRTRCDYDCDVAGIENAK